MEIETARHCTRTPGMSPTLGGRIGRQGKGGETRFPRAYARENEIKGRLSSVRFSLASRNGEQLLIDEVRQLYAEWLIL